VTACDFGLVSVARHTNYSAQLATGTSSRRDSS